MQHAKYKAARPVSARNIHSKCEKKQNVFFLKDLEMIPDTMQTPYKMHLLFFKTMVWTLFICYKMPVWFW